LSDAKSAIEVRPGSESDFPAITGIQQRSPEAAQWPLGDYAGFPLLVARVDATIAGFCCWRRTAPGEAELLNIAVDPAFRRRGVASALLEALSAQAQGTVFLEVAEPNTAAITLYRRHGWEQVGLRIGYYGQGTINGIVMKKRSW
jgi:[ribosomal protein S18]-alanine N-acetyltransferase